MAEKVMAVFTAKSVKRCLTAGGTQSWVLDRANAKQCRYAVLCRNAHSDWGDSNEPHGTAFMVGRVSDVVPSTETEGRWLVKFDEYAVIDAPEVWKGWRNPVRYTTFEELGLSLDEIRFQPMPEATGEPVNQEASPANLRGTGANLTIADAKKALAATFGVKPEAIEITIHA
jgi:hypothetical protein